MQQSVYQLTKPTPYKRPVTWRAYTHYDAQPDYPPEGVLPPGTWILPLETAPAFASASGHSAPEHLYRLANGQIVTLDPQPEFTGCAVLLLDNPQGAEAMLNYPVREALYRRFNLVEEEIANVPIFKLIACPLCGGQYFVSLALATTWCGRCNTRFVAHHAFGDPPGVTIDCYWDQYSPGAYILPRSRANDLFLTKTIRPGCPDSPWRFNGSLPLRENLPYPERYRTFEPEQRPWGDLVAFSSISVDGDSRSVIENAANLLTCYPGSKAADRTAALNHLLAVQASCYLPPETHPLPPATALLTNQQFLLHHWDVPCPDIPATSPGWYIVRSDNQKITLIQPYHLNGGQ